VSVSSTTTATSSGSGTGRRLRSRQSISSAWPSTPAAPISWSMMPLCTPTHRFSTRCIARAMAGGSQAKPLDAAKAAATASSTAADDDRPAPRGTSEASAPSKPRKGVAHVLERPGDAAGYSSQPPSGSRASPRVSRERAVATAKVPCWPRSSAASRTTPSARGASAIQAARSSAIGSTKPSL
jgi:hypothetical protein